MKTNNLLPPQIFQMSLLLIAALHFIVPVWFIYDSPIRFLGLAPIFAGIYLNIYSDWLIKKYKTTIKPFEEPTTLIEKGPFRFSRNPIYLGMVLIVFGFTLLSSSVVTFVVPVFFALILYFKYIVAEDILLEKSFGKNYLEYKYRVRCWI